MSLPSVKNVQRARAAVHVFDFVRISDILVARKVFLESVQFNGGYQRFWHRRRRRQLNWQDDHSIANMFVFDYFIILTLFTVWIWSMCSVVWIIWSEIWAWLKKQPPGIDLLISSPLDFGCFPLVCSVLSKAGPISSSDLLKSCRESQGDTLWWTYKKQWKITFVHGKIHYKWLFSIAMLVHQRVASGRCSPECHGLEPTPITSFEIQRGTYDNMFMVSLDCPSELIRSSSYSAF